MKVTKKAIADYLGISRTAVSLVLNNYENCTVSEDTRKKILSAAKELGYRGESVNSRKICFVLYKRQPDDLRYMIDLRNIEHLCSLKDYKLLFLCLQSDNGDFNKLTSYVDSEDIDGAIIAGNIDGNIINAIKSTKVPFVIYGGVDREDVNVVSQNAEKVSYNAVKHLLKLEHKRIALFSGTFNLLVHRQILEGYRKALESEKVEFDTALVQVSSSEDGYELAERMHVFGTDYSAIFCANTIIQFGTLQWLKEKGIAVPEKVSLLGYGNSELVRVSSPKLTTFSFDYEEYAQIAVEKLFNLMSGKAVDKNTYTNNVVYIKGGTVGVFKASR